MELRNPPLIPGLVEEDEFVAVPAVRAAEDEAVPPPAEEGEAVTVIVTVLALITPVERGDVAYKPKPTAAMMISMMIVPAETAFDSPLSFLLCMPDFEKQLAVKSHG